MLGQAVGLGYLTLYKTLAHKIIHQWRSELTYPFRTKVERLEVIWVLRGENTKGRKHPRRDGLVGQSAGRVRSDSRLRAL